MSIRRQGILVLVIAALVAMTIVGVVGGWAALGWVLAGIGFVFMLIWFIAIFAWAIWAAFTGKSLFGDDPE